MATRRPPKRRETLDRGRVLDAALALLDEEGLEALSMRAVAARLGVEAMSLYNHVESKEALLDGLHERVLSGLESGPTGGWSERLRCRALSLREALARHPSAIPLFATRPAVTQGSLAHVEAALDDLRRAGFSPGEALSLFQIVFAFVVGHAATTLGQTAPGPRYEALDRERFPRVREAASALASRSLDAEFRKGLSLLLAGADAQLAGKKQRSPA